MGKVSRVLNRLHSFSQSSGSSLTLQHGAVEGSQQYTSSSRRHWPHSDENALRTRAQQRLGQFLQTRNIYRGVGFTAPVTAGDNNEPSGDVRKVGVCVYKVLGFCALGIFIAGLVRGQS